MVLMMHKILYKMIKLLKYKIRIKYGRLIIKNMENKLLKILKVYFIICLLLLILVIRLVCIM